MVLCIQSTFPSSSRDKSRVFHNTSTWQASNYNLASPSGYNASASEGGMPSCDSICLANVQGSNLTSQGMVVTSTIPLYEVCDLPAAAAPGAAGSTSCSTVHDTITTSSCSTVMTAGFDRFTIRDCNQNVTFSTHHSYSVVLGSPTTTAAAPALHRRDAVACRLRAHRSTSRISSPTTLLHGAHSQPATHRTLRPSCAAAQRSLVHKESPAKRSRRCGSCRRNTCQSQLQALCLWLNSFHP